MPEAAARNNADARVLEELAHIEIVGLEVFRLNSRV